MSTTKNYFQEDVLQKMNKHIDSIYVVRYTNTQFVENKTKQIIV
jgi:hypothetical protein